ncbi:MAG: ribosomal protein S18-alanine N-acetyltransferase [Gammaproteobacteria bacterium]|nr:ribosomal protein S18-alanine N-acetyltransferase [Gammaproteobacteria bacterium]
MHPTDIPTVMQIEESIYEFPWTKGIFTDCIRVGYDCWVATLEDMIIAYGVLSSAAQESHVLNLATRHTHQHQGIGRQFLHHLIDIARLKSSEIVLLEVRPSNQAAIKLYESTGFNEIGCRKAYYPAPNGKEDALIFALQL